MLLPNDIVTLIKNYCENFSEKSGKIIFLTGAGISAESGIPTYRGVEGYWVKGSRNYKPEEIGTLDFFRRAPYEVWKFSLFRKTLCENAQPNAAHYALSELEKLLPKHFQLITQNVDRLHIKAGSNVDKIYEIHGNIAYMRCSKECSKSLYPYPTEIRPKKLNDEIPEREWKLLKCPRCGELTRPNVLWFDETYNEWNYKYKSALLAAEEADLLFVVGTHGATTLPLLLCTATLHQKKTVIDINLTNNKFAELLAEEPTGKVLRGNVVDLLPAIVETFKLYLPKS